MVKTGHDILQELWIVHRLVLKIVQANYISTLTFLESNSHCFTEVIFNFCGLALAESYYWRAK